MCVSYFFVLTVDSYAVDAEQTPVAPVVQSLLYPPLADLFLATLRYTSLSHDEIKYYI